MLDVGVAAPAVVAVFSDDAAAVAFSAAAVAAPGFYCSLCSIICSSVILIRSIHPYPFVLRTYNACSFIIKHQFRYEDNKGRYYQIFWTAFFFAFVFKTFF